MRDSGGSPGTVQEGARWFTTTQWNLIVEAGDSKSPHSREALETLCQTYWPPVYSYIQRRGYDREAALDLTQGFFTQLLEKKYLKIADRERGRFRSFLLTSVKHYLASDRQRERAKKRGGGKSLLQLEFSDGKLRFEPTHKETPETVFERRWVASLLEESLNQLRDEQTLKGTGDCYDQLELFLTGETLGIRYREVAEALAMNEEAVRVRVYRLRRRFGDLLRQQIADTLADPNEADDEIRYLLSVINFSK